MSRVRVLVELFRSPDVRAWESRHARLEAPDAWPYGLDRLRGHGVQVLARPPAGRPANLAGGAVSRAAGGVRLADAVFASLGGVDARLAWEERVGLAALADPRPAARRLPVATGVVWLTEDGGVTRRQLALARALLPRAAAVWALADAQVQVLADRFGVPPSRVHYLPFGVDVDFWSVELPPEQGRVLSVGNDRHRDHATLLAAMGSVVEQRPAAAMELVTRTLPGQAPPWLEHVPSLSHAALRARYAAASVVAVVTCPNLHVSGITAVLEARACGRPVVVTDTPGMRAYVEHGIDGLLVPPGDAAAVALEITGLLADPDRATAMGQAGRRRVAAEFSTELQAGRLAGIIRAM